MLAGEHLGELNDVACDLVKMRAVGSDVLEIDVLVTSRSSGCRSIQPGPAARLIVDDLTARPPSIVRADVAALAIRLGITSA